MKQINYVGTRWHKCDLHLHTPASKCFKDQSVTPEQWVKAALDKGLSCVAVTDHNTGEWIDRIKEAAKDTELTVFPGVEITCSDAKVHLLVIFDLDKTSADIANFLLLAGIEPEAHGKQNAHANNTSTEIISIAAGRGAIIIPAHIDEFNGICEIKHEPRLTLLKRKEIRSVQVVHKDFTLSDGEYNKLNKDELISKLNTYYNRTEKDIQKGRGITMERVRSYRQAVKQSQELNCAILSFSDNPHQERDSQHGLWGIGTRFTWIKMDKEPTLECLKQSLLVPEDRIINDFELEDDREPYQTPDTWIESIKFGNTIITDLDRHLSVMFSPQMTSIVGGRGSGKSSILGFLRGAFPVYQDQLKDLPNIQREFLDFFKKPTERNKKGVLNTASEIEIILYRRRLLYKVEYKENETGLPKVWRFNTLANTWDAEEDENFIDLFGLDIYSQKQIYEIANQPNALRNKIDNDIEGVADLQQDLKELRSSFLAHCAHITDLKEKISKKGTLEMEIRDIESRLAALDIESLKLQLNLRQEFSRQEGSLNSFKSDLERQIQTLSRSLENFKYPNDLPSVFDNSIYKDDFKQFLEPLEEDFKQLQEKASQLLSSGQKSINNFIEGLAKSKWNIDKEVNEKAYSVQQEKMVEDGFQSNTRPEEIEQEMRLAQRKGEEIHDIERLEKELEEALLEKERMKEYFFEERDKLTQSRFNFLSKLLKDNVRAKIKKCGDLDNLERSLRRIFNADNTYKSDFEALKNMWSPSREAIENNKSFIKIFEDIQAGKNNKGFTGFFVTKVKGLLSAQMDELNLAVPEDKIIIEYKANTKSPFRPIATASPGQKTAAILTFLLSHGDNPLIIDQPEDDLDTSLIHKLVVRQLRDSKKKRQVIVVTHNPNIPVNGDSEHIIVMNSDSKFVETKHEGSIDDEKIRELICDVMEGGVEAFNLRSQRYKLS